MSEFQFQHAFRVVSFPVRVYSGKDALGNLPAELKRNKAKRAYIICGRSVSRAASTSVMGVSLPISS